MATMEEIPSPSPTSMNSLNSVSCKPVQIKYYNIHNNILKKNKNKKTQIKIKTKFIENKQMKSNEINKEKLFSGK